MGKLKGFGAGHNPARRRQGGFLLLDTMISLFIVLIGFGVFLGSLGLSERLAARQNDRISGLVEHRSTYAKERTILFQGE